VLVALQASAQDKPPAGKAAATTKEAYDKMVAAGEITGKLTTLADGSQKYMTLEVSVKYQVPNPAAAQEAANLQRQVADASRDKNPAKRAQRLNDLQLKIAQNQQNQVTTKEEKKKVEVQAGEDMKVRTIVLAPMFDDKGNVKKPTPKQLKELKGSDPKLPGYTATAGDLKQDQTVKVFLAKKKKTDKADKDDKDNKDENRPLVSMILIIAEPPAK